MTSTDYRWIDCQGCNGEIGVPFDRTEGIVNCPSCGAGVEVRGKLLFRPKPTQASAGRSLPSSAAEMTRPPRGSGAAPAWMKPWGWLLTWLGVIGFFASTYANWRDGHEFQAFGFGFLNPMCFVGLPIGLYWLSRSGVTVGGVLTAINESTLPEHQKSKRTTQDSTLDEKSEGGELNRDRRFLSDE
jgi:hypothetical protein